MSDGQSIQPKGNSSLRVRRSKHYAVDGLWSWVVAAGAFWVTFFIMGLFRCYGILFVDMLQLFGVSRQEASWPFSLCGTVLNVSGLLPGILSQFFSVRQIVMLGGFLGSLGVAACYFATGITGITICFGIFYGLGIGIIIPTQPVLLNRCFKKYRAMACGLCFAGGALSSMLFPQLAEQLLLEYGLRGSFLIFGGIILNSIVGASLLCEYGNYQQDLPPKLLVNNNYDEQPKPMTQEAVNLLQNHNVVNNNDCPVVVKEISFFRKLSELLTDSIFYFTALSSASGWMACFTFSMVVVDFGVDQKLNKDQAVMLITVFSSTEFVGRLCSGWLSDSGLVKRKNVMLVAASLSGVVLILFPFTVNPVLMYALTAIYGLLVGSQIILYYVLLADYIGPEKLALGVSLAFSFGGTLSLTRPLLVGGIRDVTGSYHGLFYLLGFISLLGGLVWLLEPFVIRRREKRRRELNINQGRNDTLYI